MASFFRPSRLLALCALSATLGAAAADDIYMQLPGIKGESTEITHAGWIDVLSFNGCVSNTGKASACEISIGKYVDQSSTYATGYLLTGKSFGTSKVLIDICRTTGTGYVCYYKIEMNYVVFSAASSSTASGSDRVSESWSMSFRAIKWTYTPIDAKGGAGTPVSQCWDFSLGNATCP